MSKSEYPQKKKWNLKRGILLLVSAALIGMIAFSVNAERLLGNPMPMPFGYGISVVLSGSMTPVLNTGDLIFVQETDDISVGDVVVYQSGKSLIVHRIIALTGDTVTVKGDANDAADEPFSRSAVKGKVVGSIPVAGYVVQAIKTPLGMLLILAAAILLMELSFRADKRRNNEEADLLRAEILRLREEQENQAS